MLRLGTGYGFAGASNGLDHRLRTKTIHALTDDMLINQLQRNAHRSGASFDRLCLDEIRTISRLSLDRESMRRFARVRQVEPLLQEVNPQHLLQSQRLATSFGFGVVRFDQPAQARPWNHRIHLGQEPLPPGDLPFPYHASMRTSAAYPSPHLHPADPTNYPYPN
jgi:hypothetical protein